MRLTNWLVLLILAEAVFAGKFRREIPLDKNSRPIKVCTKDGMQARFELSSETSGSCTKVNITVDLENEDNKSLCRFHLDYDWTHQAGNVRMDNTNLSMSPFESLTIKLAAADSFMAIGDEVRSINSCLGLEVSSEERVSCFNLKASVTNSNCGIALTLYNLVPPAPARPSTRTLVTTTTKTPASIPSSTSIVNEKSSIVTAWWLWLIVVIAAILIIAAIAILIWCILWKCRKGKPKDDSEKDTRDETNIEEGKTMQTDTGYDTEAGIDNTKEYDTKTLPDDTINNSDTAKPRSPPNTNTSDEGTKKSEGTRQGIAQDNDDKLTESQSHYLGDALFKPAVKSNRYKAKK